MTKTKLYWWSLQDGTRHAFLDNDLTEYVGSWHPDTGNVTVTGCWYDSERIIGNAENRNAASLVLSIQIPQQPQSQQ